MSGDHHRLYRCRYRQAPHRLDCHKGRGTLTAEHKNVNPAPQWHSRRQGAGALLFTALFIGLVALALVDLRASWFIGWLLLDVVVAATFFSLAFPGTRFFTIAFANALAVYACVFNFFVEANFATMGPRVLSLGFTLPILAFCVAAALHRQQIRSIIETEQIRDQPHMVGGLSWLLPVFAVGAVTFALPSLGLGHPALNGVFLGAMAAIALIVLFVGPAVATFLIGTGLLFEAFFDQANRALLPIFAFLTFYSILVIVFAAFYRILDLATSLPNFTIAGRPYAISFGESLYFSVITMATVGYGDITPLSDLARLIAAVQVVVGLLLLLFGFSEILAYTRDRSR